jgi:hypothetical protein
VARSRTAEAGKCPLLVGPGKLAESDHIRRKKAASFRVSAMAVPSPHAILARLLIGQYRLWVQHLIQHPTWCWDPVRLSRVRMLTYSWATWQRIPQKMTF